MFFSVLIPSPALHKSKAVSLEVSAYGSSFPPPSTPCLLEQLSFISLTGILGFSLRGASCGLLTPCWTSSNWPHWPPEKYWSILGPMIPLSKRLCGFEPEEANATKVKVKCWSGDGEGREHIWIINRARWGLCIRRFPVHMWEKLYSITEISLYECALTFLLTLTCLMGWSLTVKWTGQMYITQGGIVAVRGDL